MAITDNLEKMLAAGRDSAMLRFGLGSAYFNQRQFVEATEHLRACIEQDSNYTAAYKLLGRALMKTQQPELAQQIFERGLPVAQAQGDKQTEREINAFLTKLSRT
ncbi:MAG: Tfp pilus assembly protein PilF [Candidatus Pseudothioglobus sp.]|jgi:Tfp pilus assembly protein PilF